MEYLQLVPILIRQTHNAKLPLLILLHLRSTLISSRASLKYHFISESQRLARRSNLILGRCRLEPACMFTCILWMMQGSHSPQTGTFCLYICTRTQRSLRKLRLLIQFISDDKLSAHLMDYLLFVVVTWSSPTTVIIFVLLGFDSPWSVTVLIVPTIDHIVYICIFDHFSLKSRFFVLATTSCGTQLIIYTCRIASGTQFSSH